MPLGWADRAYGRSWKGTAVTTSDSPRPAQPRPTASTVEDLFDASEPVQRAEDLARNGVFDDGEVEQFLTDLYAMRRSDVA